MSNQSFFYPGSSDTTIKVYDIFKKYFTHSFKGSGDVVRLISILMPCLSNFLNEYILQFSERYSFFNGNIILVEIVPVAGFLC